MFSAMKFRNTIVTVASILAIWIVSMSALNIWFKALAMIAAIGLIWYAVRRRAAEKAIEPPSGQN
jgi:hypothetical protein